MDKIIIPESFPNLPAAVKKIQKMFATNSVDNKKLTLLLQEDPLLCTNILKLVNSPHYGLRQKVTSIHQAIMLLGTTIIRGIVMAAVLKKSFPLNLSPYKITIEQFDKICTLRVNFLNEWFKNDNNDNINIQDLLSAAFLMECGKVITSHSIIQNNLHDKFIMLQNDFTLTESENVLFNMNSYRVAALLFEKWGFDNSFTKLISGVLNPKTEEQNVLYLLSTLVGVEGIFTDKSISNSLKLVKQFNLKIEKFEKTIETIKQQAY